MNVKTGDTVVVISGKDKGKQGKIQKSFPAVEKIIVAGVAIVKKHQKPRGQGMPGGIVEKEARSCLFAPLARRLPASAISSSSARARSPRRSAYARSAEQPLTIDEGGKASGQTAR